MMVKNPSRSADPRSETVLQRQAGSNRYAGGGVLHIGLFESVACGPDKRVVAACVCNRCLDGWVHRIPTVLLKAKGFTPKRAKGYVLSQIMSDTSADGVSDGIVWGGVVIYDLKTINAYQVRAARKAKLKRLGKRVVDPVLK